MKYATWTIKRPEGTTPESTIQSFGGSASGGLSVDINTVLGYMSDDVDITGLSEWNVTAKTQAEALILAQTVNPQCFLASDGRIQSPRSA